MSCAGRSKATAFDPVRPASEWREAHTLEAALRDPPPGQVVVLRDPSLIEPE